MPEAVWQEQLFGGFILWLVFLPQALLLAALLALPSALWSKLEWPFEWVGWLLSVLLALAVSVAFAQEQLLVYFNEQRWLALGAYFLPMLLAVVAPQLLAYPLTRRRPFRRLAVAAALCLFGAVVWVFIGFGVGATPD